MLGHIRRPKAGARGLAEIQQTAAGTSDPACVIFIGQLHHSVSVQFVTPSKTALVSQHALCGLVAGAKPQLGPSRGLH